MNHVIRTVEKPKRWDQPFDTAMTESDVDALMRIEPFRSMKPAAFAPTIPLSGILRNDCRIWNTQPNELVIRQGDYGNSAFLVLEGQVAVSLREISSKLLGRPERHKKSWLGAIAQLWNQSGHPEVRNLQRFAHDSKSIEINGPIKIKTGEHGTRVFLQDIPGVMDLEQILSLREGAIFGELSALSRSPRTATVVSMGCAKLLEIRWQGLRDLMQRDAELRKYIDRLYREHGLLTHLRQTPMLQGLTEDALQEIADQTEFHSLGEYHWTPAFKKVSQADIAERIRSEPIIAEQDDYVNGLILIRSGFARVSRRHGAGEQTIEYLGKGQCFGLRELHHNWKTKEQRPWQLNLRAVGFVDFLRIPTEVVERLIFPKLAESKRPAPLTPLEPANTVASGQRRLANREESLDTNMLEMLVEQRLINGKQAMVIDLNRCTRCDDCVRACATAHDGNPRFVREGLVIDQWMFASACMHCLDPVCMIGCPTGAIGRESETGIVTINDQTCIGCGTCASSCPYGNIKMVSISDPQGSPIVEQASGLPVLQATKCDLCIDQLGGPACQRACPHDALVRIDLTGPQELTSWIQG